MFLFPIFKLPCFYFLYLSCLVSISYLLGTITVQQSLPNGEKLYKLIINAQDGGRLEAEQTAEVYISVTGPGYNPPVFGKPMYRFHTSEIVAPDTLVGTVQATYAGNSNGM